MGTSAIRNKIIFCHAGKVYAIHKAKVRADIRIRVIVVVIRIRKTEPGGKNCQQHSIQPFKSFGIQK